MSNFRNKYLDEYTGETLEPSLIAAAIREELNYFNQGVWKIELKTNALQKPDAILVRSRWVLCNKGDNKNPDMRARLVACEVNKGGDKPDAFFASTPPLEAKKVLFSRLAQERTRNGEKLMLSFIDVKKACFNGIPKRDVYMSLPKELGLPSHLVAKQVRCVYGTRDAGAIWEDTYRAALEGLGFTSGIASPCCFFHKERGISIVVHGDDITSLGLSADLDWLQEGLAKSFELKLRGRIGEGLEGDNDMRILNRVAQIVPEGLIYEADPRHTEMLSNSLGLTAANSCVTPGVKEVDVDLDVIKNNEAEAVPKIQPLHLEPHSDDANKGGEESSTTAVNSLHNKSRLLPTHFTGGRMQRALEYIHSLRYPSILKGSSSGITTNRKVDVSGKLHDKTEFFNVPAYSTIYGVPPASIAATDLGFQICIISC